MSLLFRRTFPLSRLSAAPSVTILKRFKSENLNSDSSAIAKRESKDDVETVPEKTRIITADVISGAPSKEVASI